VNLIATLPKNRNIPGELVALDDAGREWFRCDCFGKSDNAKAAAEGNARRDPLKRYGDTPTGTYRLERMGPWSPARTYGPHPVLLMVPTGGDALTSHSGLNPRRGLAIHGGDLGRNRKTKLLRPTWGCVRVHNESLARIWELALTHGSPKKLEVLEI
jgi:hypothetical protein